MKPMMLINTAGTLILCERPGVPPRSSITTLPGTSNRTQAIAVCPAYPRPSGRQHPSSMTASPHGGSERLPVVGSRLLVADPEVKVTRPANWRWRSRPCRLAAGRQRRQSGGLPEPSPRVLTGTQGIRSAPTPDLPPIAGPRRGGTAAWGTPKRGGDKEGGSSRASTFARAGSSLDSNRSAS
jgi:hypothetical protein